MNIFMFLMRLVAEIQDDVKGVIDLLIENKWICPIPVTSKSFRRPHVPQTINM